MAYIGVETGLFRAMAGKGPMLPEDGAAASGLQPRYVEEWLKGVTTAGYLEHDPKTGTFTLPGEHAYLLASEGADHFMGGLLHFAPVALRAAPRVAEALRSGGGVKFKDFGPDCVSALDLINAGQYGQRLGSYWLKNCQRLRPDWSGVAGRSILAAALAGSPWRSPAPSPPAR